MNDELWITAEVRLWHDFMSPRRGRLNLHSQSPEKRRELRQLMEKQKDGEFTREWEAYERWLLH